MKATVFAALAAVAVQSAMAAAKNAPELESALGDEFLVDYVRVYDIAP